MESLYFRFIECQILKQEKLNTKHIVHLFNLSRMGASKIIKRYTSKHPNQLSYCTNDKCYIATSWEFGKEFKPIYFDPVELDVVYSNVIAMATGDFWGLRNFNMRLFGMTSVMQAQSFASYRSSFGEVMDGLI